METTHICICATLFGNLNWLIYAIATIVVYALGALWYSPLLFSKRWVSIIDPNFATKKPEEISFLPMILQFFATAILGLFIFTAIKFSVALTVLFIIAAAGWQKASLFFKYPKSSTFATIAAIEVGYFALASLLFLILGMI